MLKTWQATTHLPRMVRGTAKNRKLMQVTKTLKPASTFKFLAEHADTGINHKSKKDPPCLKTGGETCVSFRINTMYNNNSIKNDFSQPLSQNFYQIELESLENNGGAKFTLLKYGEKTPCEKSWQNKPKSLSQVSLQKHGVGILLGQGNLLSIDIDNLEGCQRFVNYFGCYPSDYPSVSWSSGKTFDGDYNGAIGHNSNIQVLFKLTDSQAAKIPGRKTFKNNTLDLRWFGCQSVLPSLSPHPSTGKPYIWHHAPTKYAIAQIPDDIFDAIIADVKSDSYTPKNAGSGKGFGLDNQSHSKREKSPLDAFMDNQVYPLIGFIKIWGDLNWKDCGDYLTTQSPRPESDNGSNFVLYKGQSHAYDFGSGEKWSFIRRWHHIKTGKLDIPNREVYIALCIELAAMANMVIPDDLLADYLGEKISKGQKHWTKINKLTQGEKITNVKYVSEAIEFIKDISHRAIFIKASMGTGKTHYLTDEVFKFLKLGKTIIKLGYRNNLEYQTISRIKTHCKKNGYKRDNIYHLNDDNALGQLKQDFGYYALCIHSLHKIPDEYLMGKIVILDEVVSVFNALITDPNLKKDLYDKTIGKLSFLLRKADKILCFDANLNDATIKFFKDLTGIDPLVIDIKTNEQCIKTVKEYTGTLKLKDDEEPYIDPRDNSGMFSYILDDLINKKRVAICTDSLKQSKVVFEYLTKMGFKGIVINGETSAERDIKLFMENPDNYILNHDIQFIVYTSSMESGNDINSHFDSQYGFFFGVVDIKSSAQMIGRCRDVNDRIYWINPYPLPANNAFYDSPDDLAVHYHIMKRAYRAMVGMGNGIDEINSKFSNANDYITLEDFAAEINSARNWERYNPRKAFREYWKLNNVTVISIFDESDDELRASLKDKRKEVTEKTVLEIYNAPDIDNLTYESLRKKTGLKLDDQRKKEKHAIKRQLPGIEKTEHWKPELIHSIKSTNLVPKLNNAYLIQGDNLARVKNAKHNYIGDKDNFYEIPFYPADRLLTAYALEDFNDLFNYDGLLDKDSPIVNQVIERLFSKGDKKFVLNVLGIKPGKDNIKTIKQLLDKVGLTLKSVRTHNKRQYQIVPQYPNELWDALMQCVDRRWQAYIDNAPLPLADMPAAAVNNLSAGDVPAGEIVENVPSADVASDEGRVTLPPLYIKEDDLTRCDRTISDESAPIADQFILVNDDGCPLLTPDGQELVIGREYQVIAGKYEGLVGTLEPTASLAGNVWLSLRGITPDGLLCSKSIPIDDIALSESPLWDDIWDAVANDTFIDIWQKVKAMGAKITRMVFTEFPELISQVDPNFALGMT